MRRSQSIVKEARRIRTCAVNRLYKLTGLTTISAELPWEIQKENIMKRLMLVGLAVAALAGMSAVATAQDKELKGEIKIDGSSTVYLITEAMATQFKKIHPNVKISVGISGTGGGFKKFAAGETDISDASRPIKKEELDACQKNGIQPLEFQVAWDGIAVVIHKGNDWAKNITVEQLNKIWGPESTVKKWSDVDPKWPERPIKLYGPGTDSGTFDFFTEKVNKKEKSIRKDFLPSEDDNVLVEGVANDKYAMGYFGVAYYETNKDKLSVCAIKNQAGQFVEPSTRTVLDKSYFPLSRPLFIYVKQESMKRPEVQEFASFYLRRNDIVKESKYISLTTREQTAMQKKLGDELKSFK
jgi:phosphate transport system substrate-binding protein